MHGLIEIHTGFTTIGFTIGENFRKLPKISGNFLLELNFRKIYNPSYIHGVDSVFR